MLAGALAFGSMPGCAIDITREQVNVPLDQEAFQRLELGKTAIADGLRELGAPDKVKRAPTFEEHWYLHRDTSRVGVRLESPISLFGYQHTIAELDVNDEDNSAIHLIYDAQGTLQDKSLRLAPAFQNGGNRTKPEMAYGLVPRYAFSPLLLGDGGERDWGDLFSHGHLFGADFGILPTPYFMLLVGGNWQTFEGRAFNTAAGRVALDDMNAYEFHLGGRFQVPPEFFAVIFDIDRLKKLFYTNDMARHRGFLVYFEWTFGGVWNEEVETTIAGVPSGTYFEESLNLTNTIGIGVEWRWDHVGLWGGIDYATTGAPKDGNAPLDTKADNGLSSIGVTGGLSVRF